MCWIISEPTPTFQKHNFWGVLHLQRIKIGDFYHLVFTLTLNLSMPAWGKCKKNFHFLHFFNTDASDIIAEGECHMPDRFFYVWQAMISKKLQNFNFFTAQ